MGRRGRKRGDTERIKEKAFLSERWRERLCWIRREKGKPNKELF